MNGKGVRGMHKLTCILGKHNWPVHWRCIYDKYETATDFWFQQCTEVGCFSCRCIFNFDKEPVENTMYHVMHTKIICSACGSLNIVAPCNEREIDFRCLDCGHEKKRKSENSTESTIYTLDKNYNEIKI